MNRQTAPAIPENETSLFSKPAYITETSSAVEIRIPDCFWYPQASFDWEKLTPAEFHHLIEKIRTGLAYIVRTIYPAEEDTNRGFSCLIENHLKKNPDGNVSILLLPVKPHTSESFSVNKTSGGKKEPELKPAQKKPGIIRRNKIKYWMEFEELRDRANLAYELRKTGGYIVRTSAHLNCTRQQIHTAMKYHGFLKGEILIFRGG